MIASDNWQEAVYPSWWFDPDQGTKQDGLGDELDMKIEKKKALNSSVSEAKSRQPRKPEREVQTSP